MVGTVEARSETFESGVASVAASTANSLGRNRYPTWLETLDAFGGDARGVRNIKEDGNKA